ncbi:GAF domain-containing protein [Permianibacter fluminis]|uniref:GAF domain-containing protein n=1 Tax=Permianibacter fluminis TaxID=2738515 RepID=UPI0038B25B1E
MHADDLNALDMSSPDRKRAAYAELLKQAEALFHGERDWLANASQFSALIAQQVPELNWAGFYLNRAGELVLGPFQGKVACVRIPFDKGVCGACARTGEIQLVEDVHAFPGHIACDGASNAELVLPVRAGAELWGVFDMDSPRHGRFDAIDADGMSKLVSLFIRASDLPVG